MGNFNRSGSNRFGGGDRGGFGGRDGGRPHFQKKSWGGGQGFDKPMFKATCSECGKPCEVPFRPVNGKPVYCRDCFATKGGASGDKFPRRDFNANGNDRAFAKPHFENTNNASNVNRGNNSDVLKKIEELNAKIDRLTQAVEALSRPAKPVQVQEKVVATKKKVVAKKGK